MKHPPTHGRTYRLICDLARPIFVYRMAAAIAFAPTAHGREPMRRGAKTRATRALLEIDAVVRKYVTTTEEPGEEFDG